MTHSILDYFDWQQEFKPIQDPDNEGDKMFETYGEELATVQAAPANNVWTLIDGDNGETVVVNGFHFVNRIGYYITEKAFDPHDDIEVID